MPFKASPLFVIKGVQGGRMEFGLEIIKEPRDPERQVEPYLQFFTPTASPRYGMNLIGPFVFNMRMRSHGYSLETGTAFSFVEEGVFITFQNGEDIILPTNLVTAFCDIYDLS